MSHLDRSIVFYTDPFRREAIEQIQGALPLPGITADWAWGNSDGRGVKVAIIDSGIDGDHPAVDGRVEGYIDISEGEDGLIYDSRPHNDLFGHGTACARIIRALAPACELYSVRVLGPALTGRGKIFIAGLRWAIENGMNVCNLSLGTTKQAFTSELHALVDDACFRGIALVAAANNSPIPSFPSVFPSVISVAAHDDGNMDGYYYNPRPPVEFGAPVPPEYSAPDHGAQFAAAENSYAAPYMTGRIAQILARHPGLTHFELKTLLYALARNVNQPPGPVE